MTDILNRLPADAPNGLGGAELDRKTPLQFRLNGRVIAGFLGDTVLSAAIAAGIQIAGRHGDEALSLDESFAPLVSPGKGAALPMDRTPALPGLDLVTIGVRRDPIVSGGLLGALRHRLLGPARTLNHRFGDGPVGAPPWHNAPVGETIETDFAIVGGGVAGLSAAVAASAAGKQVMLIERTQSLGGAIRYFGAVDAEDLPDTTSSGWSPASMARARSPRSPGPKPSPSPAPRCGCTRWWSRAASPLRASSRSPPGMSSSPPAPPSGCRCFRAIARRASSGRSPHSSVPTASASGPASRALFTTPHSFAYRLALRAADAGVEVQRIVDAALRRHSRFVDFAKATGITLASALAPSHAEPLQRNKPGLRVGFRRRHRRDQPGLNRIETDQLVAAGGLATRNPAVAAGRRRRHLGRRQ